MLTFHSTLSDASLSEAQHNYRLPLPSCGGFSNFIAWGAAKDAVLALLDALGGDKMVLSVSLCVCVF